MQVQKDGSVSHRPLLPPSGGQCLSSYVIHPFTWLHAPADNLHQHTSSLYHCLHLIVSTSSLALPCVKIVGYRVLTLNGLIPPFILPTRLLLNPHLSNYPPVFKPSPVRLPACFRNLTCPTTCLLPNPHLPDYPPVAEPSPVRQSACCLTLTCPTTRLFLNPHLSNYPPVAKTSPVRLPACHQAPRPSFPAFTYLLPSVKHLFNSSASVSLC